MTTSTATKAAETYTQPFPVTVHTLSNGLKLFLSVQKNEPRIHTEIAVRAGSKHDPAETTGLAHYLEHMMFKGTSQIGALEWEKEKAFLQRISDLYEQYRQTDDPEQRKTIYAAIDSISGEAAQLVATNEYDKIVSALGAKNTNAYTWIEQTVYVNDIPSNELERWMQLESERFRMVTLRLFHTELETVYEEFNIGQDNDYRKASAAMREELFPTHPYGTQTTIGKGEHLKNPSHVNIQQFFKNYYVPNNMAIVLSGDFDPETAIQYAKRYFGDYEPADLPPFSPEQQPALNNISRREVYGQSAPFVEVAWRLDGAQSNQPWMPQLLKGLLYNQQAGLVDLNITQQQKLIEADAWYILHEEYAILGLSARPREGQTLAEVEQLLVEQIPHLRKGNWEPWLLEAVVKDYRLKTLQSFENNRGRVNALVNAFILGMPWEQYALRLQQMAAISREEVLAFAQKHLADNYVAVHKYTGEDAHVMKVEKPSITPVVINRSATSSFAENLLQQQPPEVTPEFIDFSSAIQRSATANGIPLATVPNRENDLFGLHYILEWGKNHAPALPFALTYLPYLGAGRFTAEQVKQHLFRLGLSIDISCSNERAYVTLSGLDESLEEGMKWFEDLLTQAQPNRQALDNLVQDIFVKRENAKKDKQVILRQAMSSFAKFGPDSPFTYDLSEDALHNLQPGDLLQYIHQLNGYQQQGYYFGPRSFNEVKGLIERYHHSGQKEIPAPKKFEELETPQDKVYFTHFPMVQTDILMVSKGTPAFSLEEFAAAELYNQYFGYGLSSIVFQEIRESRALAYSTYAYYSTPSQRDKAHYLQAFVGTQPDKLHEALTALRGIIDDMPVAPEQFEQTRQSVLRQMATSRIPASKLFWAAQQNLDRGFDRDLRRDVYLQAEAMQLDDLMRFQQQHVQGRHYTYLVLGDRDRIDFKELERIGPVQELTLEQLFGY